MPYALTLCLDPASASIVEAMWRALHEAGIDSDRHRVGYPPHVTLAIYADNAQRRLVEGALDLAKTWSALPVTLSGLGIFASSASILRVAPALTAELLARHQVIPDAVGGQEIDLYYRKDVWVPHITLAESLTNPIPAVAAILPLWRPVGGFLDRIDLIRFRPVEVLRSHPLRLTD